MKKTVLLIAPPRSIHTMKHIDMLHDLGMKVFYVSLRDEWYPVKNTFYVPFECYFYKLSIIKAFFRVSKIIKQVRPDIIHAHYLTPYAYFILLSKCRTIISLWGSDIRITYKRSGSLFRYFLNRVMLKADVVLIPGVYMRDYIDLKIPHLYETIWGIDVEQLGKKEPEAKKNWGFETDDFVITSIRINRDIFQIERIIDSVDSLAQKYDDIQLNIIEGPYTDYNIKIRKKCSGKSYINIHRHLSHEQYISLLKASDLAISIALEDAGPVSVKESMALGLPVVYQEIRGIDRTISMKRGFGLETQSTDELTECIELIMNNEKKTKKISQNARRFALDHFDQKKYVAKMKRIYEKLL